jgi:putative transposon-encoded protein
MSSKIINEFKKLTGFPSRHQEFSPVPVLNAGGCEENMDTLKRDIGLKEVIGRPEERGKRDNAGQSPKVKFEVFGEEMIAKEVKQSGNTGRVYLPLDWVGKHVKIVRID